MVTELDFQLRGHVDASYRSESFRTDHDRACFAGLAISGSLQLHGRIVRKGVGHTVGGKSHKLSQKFFVDLQCTSSRQGIELGHDTMKTATMGSLEAIPPRRF